MHRNTPRWEVSLCRGGAQIFEDAFTIVGGPLQLLALKFFEVASGERQARTDA